MKREELKVGQDYFYCKDKRWNTSTYPSFQRVRVIDNQRWVTDSWASDRGERKQVLIDGVLHNLPYNARVVSSYPKNVYSYGRRGVLCAFVDQNGELRRSIYGNKELMLEVLSLNFIRQEYEPAEAALKARRIARTEREAASKKLYEENKAYVQKLAKRCRDYGVDVNPSEYSAKVNLDNEDVEKLLDKLDALSERLDTLTLDGNLCYNADTEV